ncbi:PQQ-dependent sugar dehydrogenase [Scleromatobacter humisilvae]|uniref:PQQ-dependent sugar dehydrogenase n=1 Tax=Scleromatobacter humisilvae TaxID=2897159 RepID=A0A9X1YEW0_9BURK|nr:PQQ-dependent sugar dehydrogenase [Scleromatobacter humisilvae]MCK9685034.1 PQQ-dependent sugar dehydrogenase [Scleromatobacter humisilvae]
MARTRSLAFALTAAALATLATSPATAQSNMDKLKQMKVASSSLDIPLVPQTGKNADAIRANLKRVKLPPGFRIDLYAVVPDARHMAVAPATNMLFVGTRKTTVWAVTNRNNGDMATEVKSFAPSLNFKNPNGVCWTKDGQLVLAEHNRVLIFPAAEFFYESPDVAVGEIVPQGQLVPVDDESYNHGARTCRIGPDNKLYITLGQPFNVPPADKVAEFRKLGIGGIVRMDLDGTHREIYAVGVRNSVGQDFNPKDGTLWFTDNQTDGMGDGIPPGELNHATRMGQDFGYPYWNGHVKVAGSAAAPDLKDLPEPKGAVFPQVEFPAHQAQLGMTFYNGKMFPERYRGGIFVAAHGSWNSTVPTGALVNFVPLEGPDKAGKSEVFADNFRDDNNTYTGRPVDVAVLHDGSLLVSDDYAGAIYRITYAAPQ